MGGFKDGREEGVWRTWYYSGNLWSEGGYKDGRKEGVWKYWFENGKLQSEKIYKEPPTPGQRYLVCSFSEDHIMNHGFMVEFKKTGDLAHIRCVYCQHPVKSEIHEQIE